MYLRVIVGKKNCWIKPRCSLHRLTFYIECSVSFTVLWPYPPHLFLFVCLFVCSFIDLFFSFEIIQKFFEYILYWSAWNHYCFLNFFLYFITLLCPNVLFVVLSPPFSPLWLLWFPVYVCVEDYFLPSTKTRGSKTWQSEGFVKISASHVSRGSWEIDWEVSGKESRDAWSSSLQSVRNGPSVFLAF